MSTYRILRIVYDWPPPWDGLSSAPYELSKAQIKLGNKVIALTGRLGGKRLLEGKFREVENKGDLVVYNLPRALYKFGPFLSTSLFVLPYYFLLKIFKKVDLVHGHGHVMIWFNLYKLVFGWLDKTPYIAHFHITGAGREKLLESRGYKLDFFTKYFEYPLHKLSDKLGVKVANLCVFVSKDLISEAERFYGAGRKKCILVESGVNTNLFRINGENKKEKIILYVGRVDPRKSPDKIIKALKYLKGYRAIFIGRGNQEYIEELKGLAKTYNVSKKISFEGYIEYRKLAKYYRRAFVFVLPSIYEGLPKVVLEALACGTPVIASGFDIKSPIEGLYIKKDISPKFIADKILALEKSKVTVDTNFIEEHYSWLSRAKELQRYYDKIVTKE